MNCHTARKITVIIGLLVISVCAGMAQQNQHPWHRMYALVFAGQTANAVKLDRIGEYQAVNSKNELLYGLGFGVPFSEHLDGDLALALMDTSAKQHSAISADYLETEIAFKTLSCTIRAKQAFLEQRFVPWLGGGVDANFMSIDETEYRYAAGGRYTASQSSRFTTAVGAHAAAGIHIYPVSQSAIALTFEGRYTGYFSTGLLEGDLNGWAFIGGLRWDFWQLGK